MKKLTTLLLFTVILHQAVAQSETSDATASATHERNASKDLMLSETKETFDITTYNPPINWKKDLKNDNVSYTTTNPSSGGFCVIGIYAAKQSEGNIENYFAAVLKELAVTPFGAQENPKSESQITTDGWKAITGAAVITFNNSPAYIIQTTFSGFGKTATIVALLNDQSYTSFVDQFIENVALGDNAELPQTTKAQASTGSVGSIIGVWSSTNISIGNYVNSSGTFVGSADASTMEEYSFDVNNSYTYKFFGSANGKLYYTETSGNFTIEGRSLTLTPVKRKGGYSGAIKEEMEMLGKPETYDCYIGANKWEAGPFLNLHKDGNYYMWSDYPYDYYKKID
jgi:hypothetical protein